MSDHGFHLGEQSMWSKQTNLEAATRIPLMIRIPNMDKSIYGKKIDTIVETIDLYPTLVDATTGLNNNKNNNNSNNIFQCNYKENHC